MTLNRRLSLVLPKALHDQARAHLYPGDGLEAAALVLCSVVDGRRRKLLASDIILVPHNACLRQSDRLSWPGEYVENAIDRAEAHGLSVIAMHSHPGGLFEFSSLDDASDQTLMPALWHGTGLQPGSAIMTPCGAIKARIYEPNGLAILVDLVLCPGEDIALWWASDTPPSHPPLAFTSRMSAWLSRLSVCVVGVSGTGSIVAEQLARLGFGEIILIDFDKIEQRNLNRILNSTLAHAEKEVLKVDMFAGTIRKFRPETHVVAVPKAISSHEAVLNAADADIIFSCVDTAEGRHLADRLAQYLAMPLFDVGVSIPTRSGRAGERKIADIYGRIDYVQPGGATLSDRAAYTPEGLEAEYLARSAPAAFQQKVADGYIKGMPEQAPAVITLNMRAASACVMEFLARVFPFRHEPNDQFARTVFMLGSAEEEFVAEKEFKRSYQWPVAKGLCEPLLGLPALAKPRTSR